MNALLASAHTWFFDSCIQGPDGMLIVSLVEGIKGTERQYVDVGDQKLGPYFPVNVEASSKCIKVAFERALVWFIYDESFDQSDPMLKRSEGRFLYEVHQSSFRAFATAATSIAAVHQGAFFEYLLACEDRVIQVLSAAAPTVALSDASPDLTTERTSTWSAS